MAYFDFSKQSPLPKGNVVTELNMENIHLQIKPSDDGQINFKRLAVFCTEKEREDRILRRKMLIDSRKLDISRATKIVHIEVV
jgi:hypothetical protein